MYALEFLIIFGGIKLKVMNRRFSIKAAVETVIGAVRRFPVATGFLTVFIVSVIVGIHYDESIDGKNLFLMHWWTGTAFLLNVVLRLWRESAYGSFRTGDQTKSAPEEKDNASVSGIKWNAVLLIVNVLWLGIALVFRSHWGDRLSWNIATIAIVTALTAGIFLVPFLRRENGDIGLWNHILDTFTSALTSIAVGVLLTCGIDVLLFAVEMLFGVDVDWKIYVDVAWTCILFIGPLIFLQLIPRSENIGTERPGKTGLSLVHYVLMPLLAAYLVTLYAYAAKILLTWELPRGGVSWLVSISMLCLVLVVYFIYPVQSRDGERRLDRGILRCLPAVFLPLLILMTVGIIRRVGDYGITIMRLYLILFNVWCYAVCIGLILCKSRRIKWVPLSFVALLLLSSLGPQNFASITRRTLFRQIRAEVNAEAPDAVFPLDSAMYDALMTNGDSAFVFKVDSKMSYISTAFPEESYRLVDSSFSLRWRFGLYADDVQMDTVSVDNSSLWSVYPVNKDIQVLPDGYDGIIPEFYLTRILPAADTLYFNVTSDSLRVALPMASLKEAAAQQGIGSYPVYGDGIILYPSSLDVLLMDDGNYRLTISAVALIKTSSFR